MLISKIPTVPLSSLNQELFVQTKGLFQQLNKWRFRTMFSHELSEAYKPKLKQKKDELIELIKEKSAKALQSELARKMRIAKGYYRLEMSPPRVDEMKILKEDVALVKAFIKNNCYKDLTVRQAWLLFLIGTEIGLWFFLGETIGKMHLVGYKV